ncbi:MAG: restriction endonuclease subunit S [Bacteroidetes bacterium]|nr:restriction endonuclease subunit S [Bacteroidota bacterium]MBS1671191.1 restriction endonuclease subunit S [Bacteroidota bacterium]
MMKYEKYKASGIEWLGDIPTQWKIKRVKDLGVYQSGEYINANEFDEENPYPVYGGNSFRGYANKYNTEGDYVLIGRQGALCGNINYGSGKFWATEHCVVVYHKRKINVKWLGELLRVMNLNQYATSTAQPGLSVEKIKRLELPVPPPQEQTAIAQYLDTKTQAIDKKINLLTTKIEYYKELRKTIINNAVTKGLDKKVKLKESELGLVPCHWAIKRIKDVCNSIAGGTPQTNIQEYWVGNIPWIPSGKVQNNIVIAEIVEDYISKDALLKSSTKMAKRNSILIALTGATCSNIGYLTFDTAINQSIVALSKIGNNLSEKYIYYLLISQREKLRTLMTGGAQGGINQEDVKYFLIPFPPKQEQTEIATYIDAKTSTIDAIINNLQLTINNYYELRKTLINDVVTGKVKVTD